MLQILSPVTTSKKFLDIQSGELVLEFGSLVLHLKLEHVLGGVCVPQSFVSCNPKQGDIIILA